MKRFALATFFALATLGAWAYSASEVRQEENEFLDFQLDVMEGVCSSFAFFDLPNTLTNRPREWKTSVQTTYAALVAPHFASPIVPRLKLFQNLSSIYSASYESLVVYQATFLAHYADRFGFSISGGYSPVLDFGSSAQEFRKISANVYWTLAPASYNFLSVNAVGGYGWTNSSIRRKLDVSYDDGMGLAQVAGTLSSNAFDQNASVGIQFQKSVLIFNFDVALLYGLSIASRTATIETSSSTTSQRRAFVQQALLVQGHLEIDFDVFKVGVGGGKNWLSQGYQAQVSLRFDF